MNGSGCKNCPVKPCETMNYRGSTCAAQRAKLGLGDPKTNADRIRAMSDEELADKLHQLYLIFSDEGYYDFGRLFCDGKAGCIDEDGEVHCNDDRRKACVIRWLKQPVEVSGDA